MLLSLLTFCNDFSLQGGGILVEHCCVQKQAKKTLLWGKVGVNTLDEENCICQGTHNTSMWCVVCTFGHWLRKVDIHSETLQQVVYMDKKSPQPVVCYHICFYSVGSVSRCPFKPHCRIVHFIVNVRCGFSKCSEQYQQCRRWSDCCYDWHILCNFTVYMVEKCCVRQVRSDSISQSKLSKPFPSVVSINTYTTTTSVQKCTLSDGKIWKI